MKIKNLFLAGLFVLGMSACSNNDEPVGGDNGAKYDTYLKLSINNPSTTKTQGPTDTGVEGTESDITTLHVYVLNTADNKVVASHEEATLTNKTTKAFEVPEGTYGLVVVANPTTALNDLGAVDATFNFAKLIENVTNDLAKEGYNNKNFLMTTAFNEVDHRVPTTATILSTNTENAPATATVYVDRAAVKIVDLGVSLTAKGDAANDTQSKALIEGATYKGFVLINGNESFNLFQTWENNVETVTGKVLMTPQGALDGTAPNQVMKGYYNPITQFGSVDANGIYDNLKDADLNEAKAKVYTVENRPEFMFTEGEGTITSGMAATTGLIYQVIANDGETFYTYRNVVYVTAEDITKLKAFEELKGLDWADTNAPALRKKGVRVYASGKMYYTYFIQDQNYRVNTDKMFNAVMRNAVYKITITGLNDLGDDVPGGGKVTPDNPNPPIITDKSYLSVTVEVNPWVLNNIGVDL